jgi:hypothetical protein
MQKCITQSSPVIKVQKRKNNSKKNHTRKKGNRKIIPEKTEGKKEKEKEIDWQ